MPTEPIVENSDFEFIAHSQESDAERNKDQLGSEEDIDSFVNLK